MEHRQYVVAENRANRNGLIVRNQSWEAILNTDSLAIAHKCQQKWQSFTGYKTVIIDWDKGEVIG